MPGRHHRDVSLVGTAHLAEGGNVLRKSTTKPGMPMNSFLLWLQWLSVCWSFAVFVPLKLADGRRATYSTSLVADPTAADILSVVLEGIRWSGEVVDGDDDGDGEEGNQQLKKEGE